MADRFPCKPHGLDGQIEHCDELSRARAENEKLRAMVVEFVKCMVPHPTEHPTMHAAWTKGQKLLSELPCPHGIVEVPFSSFCGACQKEKT